MTSRGRRKLPQVTITTPIATSIPNQGVYAGRKPAIQYSIADVLCTELGIDRVLKELNVTLRTKYTLDTPSLRSILEDCISRNYDFGTAYGYLRSVWYGDFTATQNKFRKCEEEDQEMRRKAMTGHQIVNPTLPPRRVWDLYSNRVVPWGIAGRWPWGISHAWVDKDDLDDQFLTSINGKEWPVPIPKDVNLELIRIELLNLGAEYAWLDVLCLRQVGGRREDLRMEEWKLDVPTIGRVYQEAETVVCYFSGLGRPLHFEMGDFESVRCWFKRAWTLQEISDSCIIGGEVGDRENWNKDARERFEKEWISLKSIGPHASEVIDVFEVLSHMRGRHSTNPVDKVAGLDTEDAWTALVNTVSNYYRGQLLFLYPKPGSRAETWRPSWEQVMSQEFSKVGGDQLEEEEVLWDEEKGTNSYNGFCIESAYVRGLDKGDPHGKSRWGEVIVKVNTKKNSEEHTFKIIADHQYPITEGFYTLIGSLGEWKSEDQLKYWVAGRRVSKRDERFGAVSVFKMAKERLKYRMAGRNFSRRDQRFEKVSVFRMLHEDEIRMLMHLEVAKPSHTILV
ncbi:hypothetical protein DFS33DRAFT_1491485 [Desarmillaria ectypa]|nr:hypothetical protein DFS33DRAFT_1491485 [Desarmillaria ectypa]